MRDSQTFANGSQFGSYRIIRLLGKGGMGEVYEAIEERLNRRIALKIVAVAGGSKNDRRDVKTEALRRFVLEAKTLAKINHPSVVTIFAIDEIEGRNVIAMEFVEGPTFRQVLDTYAFAANEAAPLFVQMLEGLRSLHEAHVLHRDLKPQNLILRANGAVKILDFGIAKDNENKGEATVAGAFIGTVNYLPPDLAAGGSASERSDLWSLGAIFFEMLVGHKLIQPPNPESFLATIDYIKAIEVVFPPDCDAWAPVEMRAIIAKLCANDPENRYASAHEAIQDLRLFMNSRPPVRDQFFATVVQEVENAVSLRQRMAGQGFSASAMKRIMAMSALKQFELSEYREITGDMGDDEANQSLRLDTELVSKAIVDLETGKIRVRGTDTQGYANTGSYGGHTNSQASNQFRPFINTPVPVAMSNTQSGFATGEMPPYEETHLPTARAWTRGRALAVGVILMVVVGVVFVLQQGARARASFERAASTKLVEPAAEQSIWLEPNEIATFRWQPSFEAGEFDIQVASDSAFEKIILRESVVGDQFRPSRILDEGAYHWRLKSKAPEAPTMPASKFALSYFGALEPQVPPPNARIQTTPGREAADIDFAWTCRFGATQYHVQVSSEAAFSAPLIDRVVSDCGAKGLTLAPGSYFWRVEIDEPKAASGRWSQPARLDIAAPSALLATHREKSSASVPVAAATSPVAMKPSFSLTNPRQRHTLQFQATRGPASVANPPVVEWTPLANAREYRVQISRLADFKQLLVNQRTDQPGYSWKTPRPGRYFWRVTAANAAGKDIGESDIGELRVSLPPPSLKSEYKITPKPVASRDPLETLDVRFERIPLASQYLIQWSRDPSFGVVREVLVPTPGARLRFKDSGRYYVRAAAVDGEREPASVFSQTSVVELAERATTPIPQPASPAPGARLNPKGKFAIPFLWTAVANAEQYEIEISRDESFTVPFKTQRVATPRFVLRDSMPGGRVFWRVRTIKGKERGAWSETSSFELPRN